MASNAPPAQSHDAPAGATDAVLKPSVPVPEGAVPVRGLDFNAFADRNITVAELVENLTNVGFQASSIGQAAEIVNGMVGTSKNASTTSHHRFHYFPYKMMWTLTVDWPYSRKIGVMQKLERRRQYFLATLPI